MPKDLLDFKNKTPASTEPVSVTGPKDLLQNVARGPKLDAEGTQEEPSGSSSILDSAVQAAIDAGKGFYLGFLDTAGGILQKGMNLATSRNPLAKAAGSALLGPIGTALAEKGGKEALQHHVKGVKEDYEKNVSNWGVPGRIAGSIAGTAVPGGAMFKGASALTGLGRGLASRAALSAAGGAAAGGALGGMTYSHRDPDAMVNVPGAAVGAALGGVLSPATQALPILRSRKRPDELIKDAYNGIIKQLSRRVAKTTDKSSAEKIAVRATQHMAKKIKIQEKQAWDSLLGDTKNKVISDDTLNVLKEKVRSYVQRNADDLPAKTTKWLDKKLLSKDQMTFGELKDFRTLFRSQKEALWKKIASGDLVAETGKGATSLYDDVTNALQASAKQFGKSDKFLTANTISKEANRFREELSGGLAQVAVNRSVAAKFMNKLLNPKSATIAGANVSRVGGQAASTLRAKELQDLALQSIDSKGVFNLNAFFNGVTKDPRILGVLEKTPQYETLRGLMKVTTDYLQRGSLGKGGGDAGGLILKLGNNILDYLTTTGSRNVRKQLVNYGLISKNEKLKEFLGNRITERLLRTGATFSPDREGSGMILNIQRKRKD